MINYYTVTNNTMKKILTSLVALVLAASVGCGKKDSVDFVPSDAALQKPQPAALKQEELQKPQPAALKQGGLVHIIEGNDFSEPLNGKLVAVDFGAEWCPPCKIYAPLFEDSAKTHTGISYYSVDIDENKKIAKEFNIKSVPTTLFLRDGKEVARTTGADYLKLQQAIYGDLLQQPVDIRKMVMERFDKGYTFDLNNPKHFKVLMEQGEFSALASLNLKDNVKDWAKEHGLTQKGGRNRLRDRIKGKGAEFAEDTLQFFVQRLPEGARSPFEKFYAHERQMHKEKMTPDGILEIHDIDVWNALTRQSAYTVAVFQKEGDKGQYEKLKQVASRFNDENVLFVKVNFPKHYLGRFPAYKGMDSFFINKQSRARLSHRRPKKPTPCTHSCRRCRGRAGSG